MPPSYLTPPLPPNYQQQQQAGSPVLQDTSLLNGPIVATKLIQFSLWAGNMGKLHQQYSYLDVEN